MAKTRKMLSDYNAPEIKSLMALIKTQSKATLIKWAVEYSKRIILPLYIKHYPYDTRPENALDAALKWLNGDIKLPEAKPKILECHSAASGTDNPVAQASARAIAQSASTIHSARHCLGLALYGALAIAYDRLGTDAPWKEVEKYANNECGLMEAALKAISREMSPIPQN